MKLVIYNRALHGVRPGEKRVIAPADAARFEASGDVTIIDHPAFPHKGAREFAGLPPPIPTAADTKPKLRRLP